MTQQLHTAERSFVLANPNQDADRRQCGESRSDTHRLQIIAKLPAAIEANDIRARFPDIRFIDGRYRAGYPLMAAIEDIQQQFSLVFPLSFLQSASAGPKRVLVER